MKKMNAQIQTMPGTKSKKLRSSYGEVEVDVPQDRNAAFEPKLVPKRKKDISSIEQKR